jgi:hypothetical protein
LHRWSGTPPTYSWDLRGGSVRNMKVRMHHKPFRGSYPRHILQYLPRPDRMPLLWWLYFCVFYGGWKLTAVQLADFRISCAKLHHTCCRCCGYQSTSSSTLCLPDRMFLTLLRRRLQRIVPGFPSPYFDIRCYLFLDRIS